jgi:transposase
LRYSSLKTARAWAIKELAMSLWHYVNNCPAEGLNSRMKLIKVCSRGFRIKEWFANAIYFHLGGLNLYLVGVERS